MSGDGARRMLHSTGAAALSQFFRLAVVFGVQLLLRRRIPEGDWGLWDWSLALIMILGACRDLGLPAHVLRVEGRPFGNLLRVELVWGGLVTAFALFGAPFLALFFQGGETPVVPVLRALSVVILLEGVGQVALVYFEGELAIGKSLLPEMVRNGVFALVAAGMAVGGYGVWSLVAAQVAAAALFTASLWWRARGRLVLTHHPGQSWSLMVASLPLGGIWLVMLGMRHLDPLLLGLRFEPQVVGVYGFAYWIAFLVAGLLIHPMGRALYPALVRFEQGEGGGSPFDAYRLATLALLAVEVPAACFLFLNAEQVVWLLGGSKWVAASPVFLKILCFAPLMDPLGRFAGQFLAARHQERVWIRAGVLTLVSWAVAGWTLTSWLGPEGMAWANYLPLGALITSVAIFRIDRTGCGQLLKDLAFLYLLPLPLFAGAALLPAGWPRFGASLAAAAAALALALWRFWKPFHSFLRGDDPDLAVSSQTRPGQLSQD
jgi:PST family polysaccharide transporter